MTIIQTIEKGASSLDIHTPCLTDSPQTIVELQLLLVIQIPISIAHNLFPVVEHPSNCCASSHTNSNPRHAMCQNMQHWPCNTSNEKALELVNLKLIYLLVYKKLLASSIKLEHFCALSLKLHPPIKSGQVHMQMFG